MTHQAAERRIQVVYNVGLTEAPGLLEPVGTSTKLFVNGHNNRPICAAVLK